MFNDFTKMNVLVTGGTKGIGLATALAFAKQGAQVNLTYSWGSVEEEEVADHFREISALRPRFFQADVINDDDTTELMQGLSEVTEGIDVFISNVAMAAAVKGLDDFDLRSFGKALGYSTFPMVNYIRAIHKQFKNYPRYVVGFSSDGPDHYLTHYDMVAACKGVLEIWARYLTYHLFDEDCRVNVLRTEWVPTESFNGIFGEEAIPFAKRYCPEVISSVNVLANGSVALCSGLMDAVRGQVIRIDRGSRFYQNVMYMSDEGRFSQ